MQTLTNQTKFEIINKVHKRALQNYENFKQKEDSCEADLFLESIEKLD